MPAWRPRGDVLDLVTVELRSHAAGAVAAGSLRGCAREIGMSAPGLQHFLDGGLPRRPTLRKLAEWYSLRQVGRAERSPMAPLVGLALLVEPLADAEARRAASAEMVEIAHARYLAEGRDAPAWLLAVTPLLLGRQASASSRAVTSGAGAIHGEDS